MTAATRGLMRVGLALLQESAAGVARICDGHGRAGWQELRNKVEAFRAFEHVDLLIGQPMSSPLDDLVARAAALRRPLSVWAAEGIGFHVTAARRRPHALLQGHTLQRWAQVPLHAGMGSAVAVAALDPVLGMGADVDAALRAVEVFEATCRDNANAPHLGVAVEALGFSARAMYGELIPVVSAALESARPELIPYFWHGVGRAMYFAPTAACPIVAGSQHELDEALRTPVGGPRLNAVAGFTWAATLVNLRHPYVLERLVNTLTAAPRWIAAAGAGIQSALEVWRQCAPGDLAIDEFLGHRPSSPPAREAWNRVVVAAPRPRVDVVGDLFSLSAQTIGAPP